MQEGKDMNENLHTTLQDPTVKEIAEKIDEAVPPDSRDNYQRIVAAGMSVMFGEKTQGFIKETSAQLTQGPQDIKIIVEAALRLWQTIAQASQNQPDPTVGWMALMTLALHGLDYFDRVGRIVVTPEFIDKFFTALASDFLKQNGVGPEQMEEAIRNGRDQMAGQEAPAPAGPPAQPGLMGQAEPAEQGVPV
jgi:hypothetical protein